MGKLIDETGHVYDRLTVLYRVGTTSPAKWRCRCTCGNEVDVLGTSLRNGNTKSCGCLQRERATASNIRRGKIVEVGDQYGNLTVLEVQPRQLLCQCACGTVKWIQKHHVLDGHTTTCGCHIGYQSAAYINEIGNKYGKLTVIAEAGRDLNGRVLWLCQCECGHTKIVLGKTLRAGLVQSCGCLTSKGEWKLTELFTELHWEFIPQHAFLDLRSDNDYPLRFDFYLPQFQCLVEYQGEQHYHFVQYSSQNTKQDLINLQRRDELKRNYCLTHNIRLIEIPYTDYQKLTIDYIKKVVMQDGSHN